MTPGPTKEPGVAILEAVYKSPEKISYLRLFFQ